MEHNFFEGPTDWFGNKKISNKSEYVTNGKKVKRVTKYLIDGTKFTLEVNNENNYLTPDVEGEPFLLPELFTHISYFCDSATRHILVRTCKTFYNNPIEHFVGKLKVRDLCNHSLFTNYPSGQTQILKYVQSFNFTWNEFGIRYRNDTTLLFIARYRPLAECKIHIGIVERLDHKMRENFICEMLANKDLEVVQWAKEELQAEALYIFGKMRGLQVITHYLPFIRDMCFLQTNPMKLKYVKLIHEDLSKRYNDICCKTKHGLNYPSGVLDYIDQCTNLIQPSV